jgi:glycine/D-amino acid oxidase-like deaminating enzyme
MKDFILHDVVVLMKTTWEIESQKHPSLKTSTETEVLVIGGGITGIWCAYLLSKSGKKVVVIEKDRIGKGQTLYTTAFINQFIDTSLSHLVKMFSSETARLVWQSGADAISLISEVVKAEDIDCDFEKLSAYMYAQTENEHESLKEEYRLAEILDFKTRLHKHPSLGFQNAGALEVKNQAKFHPMKFLYSLAEAAIKSGVEIYEKTEAIEIVGTNPVKIVTKDGDIIEADDVIIATYEPFNNPKATHFKKGMYTSYVLEYEIPKGIIGEGMYLDLSNPYHYTRIDSQEKERDIMIVGGEDHRNELPVSSAKHFKALRQYVERTFPDLEMKEKRKWRGGILEPTDGLALIGEVSPHQYVATAFSGNGMTYSAIAGMVLRSLILGMKSSYKEVYDPKRKMDGKALLYKARDYTGEFIGGALKNIFK